MIIRLDDCPPQPWKNGMGSTREIAVHPAGAGAGDFIWRVSMAEVDSAAPFSTFPGIDRQIVLLDGDGFHMTIDGGHVHPLTTPFQPYGFPGEARVAVTLAGGPTRDFNLMTRRAHARGELLVWQKAETRLLDSAIVLVYCARGLIDTVDGSLRAGEAWQPAAGAAAGAISLRDGAMALAVRVTPRP